MSARGTTARVGVLLALLIVIAAACGSSSKSGAGNGSTTTKVASEVTASQLNGKKFQSTTVTGHDLVPGTHITLTFESGQLGAQAGCNTMSAPYEVSGGTLRWTSEPALDLDRVPERDVGAGSVVGANSDHGRGGHHGR